MNRGGWAYQSSFVCLLLPRADKLSFSNEMKGNLQKSFFFFFLKVFPQLKSQHYVKNICFLFEKFNPIDVLTSIVIENIFCSQEEMSIYKLAEIINPRMGLNVFPR